MTKPRSIMLKRIVLALLCLAVIFMALSAVAMTKAGFVRDTYVVPSDAPVYSGFAALIGLVASTAVLIFIYVRCRYSDAAPATSIILAIACAVLILISAYSIFHYWGYYNNLAA